MASVDKAAVSETQTNSTIMSPSVTNEAAHKALFTRELLCNIVTHLPFQGILAATGVCREWRAALVGDPNIREDLFLKPAKVRLVLAHKKFMRNTEITIPLNGCHILGTTLPLLNSIFDKITFVMKGAKFSTSTNRPGNSIRHMPASGFDAANNFWRDMFITQPPCSKISISAHRRLKGPFVVYERYDMNFRRARGIKLGELYDLFHSRLTADYYEYPVVLTVRDWILAEHVRNRYSFGGRVICKVVNGEVQRPDASISTEDYSDFESDSDYNG